MRRDNRERRVRNTLTVDLGREWREQERFCTQSLGELARGLGMTDLRVRNRGQLIRIALRLLVHTIKGESNPLGRSILAPKVITDDTLRRFMGNTQGSAH